MIPQDHTLRQFFSALVEKHFSEEAGIRYQIPGFESLSDAIENGPKHSPLRFGQTGFASQPPDVPVGFPRIQLPRIDNFFPFRQKEAQAEPMTTNLVCNCTDHFADLLAGNDPGMPAMRFEQSSRDRIKGPHIDAFS